MSFSRPIQWYHSHAVPIWPDGTFNRNLMLCFVYKCAAKAFYSCPAIISHRPELQKTPKEPQ